MPVWVDEMCGGWRNRTVIDAFDYYVRVCFKNFGNRVKYWLSINEQNMQMKRYGMTYMFIENTMVLLKIIGRTII